MSHIVRETHETRHVEPICPTAQTSSTKLTLPRMEHPCLAESMVQQEAPSPLVTQFPGMSSGSSPTNHPKATFKTGNIFIDAANKRALNVPPKLATGSMSTMLLSGLVQDVAPFITGPSQDGGDAPSLLGPIFSKLSSSVTFSPISTPPKTSDLALVFKSARSAPVDAS